MLTLVCNLEYRRLTANLTHWSLPAYCSAGSPDAMRDNDFQELLGGSGWGS